MRRFTMNDNNTSEFVKVPIDQKARELYDKLGNEKFNTRPWRIEDIGEDMAVASKVIMEYWKPRYLIDHNAKCAYEFMNRWETLCSVELDDIDWDSLNGLPEECIERAKTLDFHFPSFIRTYKNGVAEVSWQLNPDGRYYMDDDGFGMTDDEEVTIYGFIDKTGKALVKFRNIHEDWNVLRIMRYEAEQKVKQQSNQQ